MKKTRLQKALVSITIVLNSIVIVTMFGIVSMSASPNLAYFPSSHDFGDMHANTTDMTYLYVYNSGCECAILTYILNENCFWITVMPTNGSSTGEEDMISVLIDTTNLTHGPHKCDIFISSNNGDGIFTVTVNIVMDWNIWDNDNKVTLTEIQEAIYYWINSLMQKNHILTLEDIQLLIFQWLNGV